MMESDRYLATRLSKEEFATALRKGLGRASLYVIHHSLDDVIDLVLEACIHNQSYDPEYESSRATWLFSMFSRSAYYSKFREAILNALKTETSTSDLVQLCQLAKEMAAQGDECARQKLGERVREIASNSSSDDWIGADEWIELQGVDGLLELARIYGRRLLCDPDDLPHDYPFPISETEQELKEVLLQYSKKEYAIKMYCDYLEEQGALSSSPVPIERKTSKLQARKRFRKKNSLESIINDARSGVGKFPGRYATFGYYATTKEIKEVYACLLKETEESVCLRLLWVFSRAPMPTLNEILFNWAVGTNEALRAASIAALAQVSDEQVHDLARSKVRTGNLLGADSEVLYLFLHNYESKDAHLIIQALASIEPNPDEAHDLGCSIIQLAELQEDVGLVDSLTWVYENTPCTFCRYDAIVQIDRFQKLNDTLLYECQFDADEEIRAFAQKRGK